MHGLVNTLVIDDDPQQRHDLGVILNFMGEHHNALSSQDLTMSLWEQPWGGLPFRYNHEYQETQKHYRYA